MTPEGLSMHREGRGWGQGHRVKSTDSRAVSPGLKVSNTVTLGVTMGKLQNSGCPVSSFTEQG